MAFNLFDFSAKTDTPEFNPLRGIVGGGTPAPYAKPVETVKAEVKAELAKKPAPAPKKTLVPTASASEPTDSLESRMKSAKTEQEKISVFANTIRTKHPDLAKGLKSDGEIVNRVLNKYPEYNDLFRTEPTVTETPEAPKEEPTFLKRLGKIAEETLAKGEEIEKRDQTGAETFLQEAGAGASFLSGVAGETVKTLYGQLPESVRKYVGTKAGEAGKAIAEAVWPEAVEAGKRALVAGGKAWEDFKKTNPRAAANVTALVEVGEFIPTAMGAKVAGKAATATAKGTGKLAGKATTALVESNIGLASGVSRQAQQAIKAKPALYKAARTGEMTRESVFEETKDALDKRIKDLSELGEKYALVEKSDVTFEKSGVRQMLNDAMGGGKITDLPFEDRKAINAVEQYLSELPETMTAKDYWKLRQKIDSTVSWDKGVTDQGRRIVKDLRKRLDEKAKSDIPGLKELDEKYAPEVKLLERVKTEIYNPDGTVKDTAISNIANITGKGKEFRLERLNEIIPELGDKVQALKAFEEVKDATSMKTGTIARYLTAGAAWSTQWPLWAVAALVFTNPLVVTFALEKYGFGKSAVADVLSKVAKGIALPIETAKKVEKAIINTSTKDVSEFLSGTFGKIGKNKPGKVPTKAPAKAPKKAIEK